MYSVECNVFTCFKNTLLSTYCTLSLLLYAQHALIGQLSGALWLAEYLKHVMEMLRPAPYCDAFPGETKTIKPIINLAFVASSGDIITDYDDLYTVFLNMSVLVIIETQTASATLHGTKLTSESSSETYRSSDSSCSTL